MVKFEGVLFKEVPANYEIGDAEAETVENLIKRGYIIIYRKRGEKIWQFG